MTERGRQADVVLKLPFTYDDDQARHHLQCYKQVKMDSSTHIMHASNIQQTVIPL
jgi:hypothetical protein